MNFSNCQVEDMCVAECAPPPAESCNGADDDCDGVADEWPACNNSGSADFAQGAILKVGPQLGNAVHFYGAATCVDLDGDGTPELALLEGSEDNGDVGKQRLDLVDYDGGQFGLVKIQLKGNYATPNEEDPYQMSWSDQSGGGCENLFGDHCIFASYDDSYVAVLNISCWDPGSGCPEDEWLFLSGTQIGQPAAGAGTAAVCNLVPDGGVASILAAKGTSLYLANQTLLHEFAADAWPIVCNTGRSDLDEGTTLAVSTRTGGPGAHHIQVLSVAEGPAQSLGAIVVPDSSISNSQAGGTLFVQDANHDGRSDVLTCVYPGTATCGTVRVYLRQADGSYLSGWEKTLPGDCDENFAVADVDGDGDPDIATGCQSGMTILRNNGDGTFAGMDVGAVNSNDSWGDFAYLCDLTGDGDPDYVQAWKHDGGFQISVYKGLK
jgi:hypothetical protein